MFSPQMLILFSDPPPKKKKSWQISDFQAKIFFKNAFELHPWLNEKFPVRVPSSLYGFTLSEKTCAACSYWEALVSVLCLVTKAA